MTSTTVDYRTTVFEFPTLTKIHGEPTFEGVRRLHKELMVNAQTVHSDLGGGAHGHLGLVLSPARYALISNTAYNRPNHPGPLVIPAGTTQHIARTMKDQHTERLRVFREVMGVEQALKQQVVTAVEPQYIEALRDPTTGRIQAPVSDVIRHLFQVYGKVTPQALYEQEQKVQQMVYDPQHPIDGVFTAVDDLVNFSEAAQTPYTQAQCINLAYLIINRTGYFQRWIIDWNEKPQVQKTWTNFKIHFRQAHQELKETTNLQVKHSSYHANAVQEVLQELRDELKLHKSSSTLTPHDPPSLVSTADDSNASTISSLQSELASLKDFVHNMQQTVPSAYPTPMAWPSPHGYYPSMFQPYPPPQMPYPPHPYAVPNVNNTIQQTSLPQKKKHQMFYCWTHGACFHKGAQCRNKASGHIDNATFSNRQGGSVRNFRNPAQPDEAQST